MGVLAIGLLPHGVSADVVHLTNGRTMEGVVLEESAEQVRLRLPFGEIGLPAASVSVIERGPSALEEYLQRRRALRKDQGTAVHWLELAQWAYSQGLDHNAREATMVAARLDPGLPGLRPLMTALGYEYEPNLAVWLSHDETMRRRGYVQSQGRWLSPAEAEIARRYQEEAAARELERRRRDRVARALEMIALNQMVQAEEDRRLREEAVASQGMPIWGGYPVWSAPGYWPRPPLRPVPHPRHPLVESGLHHTRNRDSHNQAIVRRPPGSLIPVATPARGHSGSFQDPSGDP